MKHVLQDNPPSGDINFLIDATAIEAVFKVDRESIVVFFRSGQQMTLTGDPSTLMEAIRSEMRKIDDGAGS